MIYTIILILAIIFPSLVQAQWPNQPTNGAIISDWDWSSCPGGGWISAGCGPIRSDASAPLSPPLVMNYEYNPATGFGGGDVFIFPNSLEIYFALKIKLSSPFEGTANGANKLVFAFDGFGSLGFYLKFEGQQGSNLFFPSFSYTSSDPPAETINNCHITQNFYIADPSFPCVVRQWNASSPAPLGSWFTYEFYYRHSSCLTCQNGIVRIHLNGIQILNLTNLNTYQEPVTQLDITPTWTPPIDRSNPDIISFDHVRLMSCTNCQFGGGDTTPPNPVTGITVE